MSSPQPFRAIVLIVATLLILPVGPGCSPKPVNSIETYNSATLEEVSDLYRSASSANQKPPESIQDLARNRDLFMNGYKALEQGDIIVYWGVALVPGDQTAGDEILAYKSDVPTAGGPVLMKDGTVRKMSADQFKAAKKAGKGL